MVKHFAQLIKKVRNAQQSLSVQTEVVVEYDQFIRFPNIGRCFWESELIFTGVRFADGVHQFEAPGGWLVYDDPDQYRVVDTLVLGTSAVVMSEAA